MKKLVIYRHAKSSWAEPFLEDHKRPLAERGLRDAPRMAQRLKRKNIKPDYILSSDAERAKTTALITAENMDYAQGDVNLTNKLYLASSNHILKTIRHIPDSKKTAFIFGHNPGLNDLIENLGGEIDNLPTCGQFGFIFETDSWEKIGPSNAKVWFFDFPKNQTGN
ncbi:SixA phosphatase family protein [Echinicola salinicaeni]|uniref:SixA phosphatase family protein n=1 Tax=Echinicola salinicaeni TaxID=2762757 RepID=UPI00164487B7|nr:histidine phosphatase family protein [Echinicola salinicaeni]